MFGLFIFDESVVDSSSSIIVVCDLSDDGIFAYIHEYYYLYVSNIIDFLFLFTHAMMMVAVVSYVTSYVIEIISSVSTVERMVL